MSHSRHRTSYLIKRAELLVRGKLEGALKDLGITTGQYAALSLLADMPETSSATLARSIGVTPQTITETILTFEQRGLISREQSAEHKRIMKITLTDAGSQLLKTCEARVSQTEEQLFHALDDSEVKGLRRALHTLLAEAAKS